jgi:hypothetical protein
MESVVRERFAALTKAAALPSVRIEVVAAGLLTLGALALIARQVYAAPPVQPNVSMQVTPAPAVAPIANTDAAVADFMEKFALSRVTPRTFEEGPLKAEPTIEAPVKLAALAVAAPKPAPTAEAQPVKPRPRPAAAKPAPLPPRATAERKPAIAEPEAQAVQLAVKPEPRRIPVISTIADALPSGQDITRGVKTSVGVLQNGVNSVGRKIGSIFGRG